MTGVVIAMVAVAGLVNGLRLEKLRKKHEALSDAHKRLWLLWQKECNPHYNPKGNP